MKLQCNKSHLFISDTEAKGKFLEDSIDYGSGEYDITARGYFLNADELKEQRRDNDIIETIISLYNEGKTVSDSLWGGYFLVLRDKRKGIIQVYNDLLSKHPVYYYFDATTETLIASDSMFKTLNMVNERGLPYSIDKLGVKMMVRHGMFYDDVTYIKEIHFLRPFEYLEYRNGSLERKTVDRQPMLNISNDEAAAELHHLFNNAVRQQYKKNASKGYLQITTMSGGMDSRSTFLYGLANGYNNQIGFCYGESSSNDYKYARNLAVNNNIQFFFHPIDNGTLLQYRDDMCIVNEAQMTYAGPTGTYESLKFYDTNQWGIVHTGLGGGEIMGDICQADKLEGMDYVKEMLKYIIGRRKKYRAWDSFSRSLDCNDEERKRINEMKYYYRDYNEFLNINDLRCCLNGQRTGMYFDVEYVSPFLNEVFFKYLLRIPYSQKRGRKLYFYWQKKYNPAQFAMPSTFRLGCSPKNTIGFYAKRFWKYMNNHMGRKTRHEMNPMEIWKAQNPRIGKKQEELYDVDINVLKGIIPPTLIDYLQAEWERFPAFHENILTATWALKETVRI